MVEALYPLVLLACPIGMGLMMWIMMRGGNKDSAPQSRNHGEEIALLRAEVERLRTQGEGAHAHVPARDEAIPS
jgi:hypothetical protein